MKNSLEARDTSFLILYAFIPMAAVFRLIFTELFLEKMPFPLNMKLVFAERKFSMFSLNVV